MPAQPRGRLRFTLLKPALRPGPRSQLTETGVNTPMYPHFLSQAAEVRQREMLADAERRRLARQLAKHARASRIEQRAELRMSRAMVKVLRLRSELPS